MVRGVGGGNGWRTGRTMIVPNQSNIKVHFAACENVNQFNALHGLGSNYTLYTAYPFLERVLFSKPKHPLITCQFREDIKEIPKHIIRNSRHTIQDSGLFTLMFGSQKGAKDKRFLDSYCDALIDFTNECGEGSTMVEMDTQKVLGVDSAWAYRERISSACKNRIINVFHIEDGQSGLDRLIEYSDYIAISVPELRFAGKKKHCIKIANYIKNKKPSIDIHLLGCTEMKLVEHLKFCTSCDSSSYTSGVRYGYVNGKKISRIKEGCGVELLGEQYYQLMTKYISLSSADALIINILSEMQKYQLHAGSQD